MPCIHGDQEMSWRPWRRSASASTLLAASVGWNPSQKTYPVALAHVPGAPWWHSTDVSIVPVPQHALLASKNPAM